MTDEWPDGFFQELISGFGMPPAMIDDLRVIAQLDARTVGRIVECLSQLQGLTANDALQSSLNSCLTSPNADSAKSIVRTLLNAKTDDVARILKVVDRWRQSSDERRSLFGDELFASLERNLQALIADYPSLALTRKANRLLRDVGNEFKSVSFFCDLRPVFDDPRQKVEGFITLANMRLLYISQDGEHHVCELALTEDELEELIDNAKKALAKLEVLRGVSDPINKKASR